MKPVIVKGNGLKILARIMQGPPPAFRELMRLIGSNNVTAAQGPVQRLIRLGLVVSVPGAHPGAHPALRPNVRFIPEEDLP